MKFQLAIILVAALAGSVTCQGSMFGLGRILGGRPSIPNVSTPNLGVGSVRTNLQKIADAIINDVSELPSRMRTIPSNLMGQVQRFAGSMQTIAGILLTATSKNPIDSISDLVAEVTGLLPNIPAIMNGEVQIPHIMPQTFTALRDVISNLLSPSALISGVTSLISGSLPSIGGLVTGGLRLF